MHNVRYLLVANPTAQSGRNAERIDRAMRLLAAHGLVVELLPTQPERQTVTAVKEAVQSKPVAGLISMGGDGTLREVVQGLWESGKICEIPLGMLPAGTANNHGRSFGLDTASDGLEKNVKMIATGLETRVDLGRITEDSGSLPTIFLDSIGFGIGARVISRRNAERNRFAATSWASKIYRDKRVYTVATLQELWFAREENEFAVTVCADGSRKTYPRITELLVKGTRVYAGSWVIDRTSKHDDGLFEVVAYANNRSWVLKGLVDSVGRDGLDRLLEAARMALPEVWRAEQLAIEFDTIERTSWPDVQIDGEWFAGVKRLEIDVLPRVLRLIVPG